MGGMNLKIWEMGNFDSTPQSTEMEKIQLIWRPAPVGQLQKSTWLTINFGFVLIIPNLAPVGRWEGCKEGLVVIRDNCLAVWGLVVQNRFQSNGGWIEESAYVIGYSFNWDEKYRSGICGGNYFAPFFCWNDDLRHCQMMASVKGLGSCSFIQNPSLCISDAAEASTGLQTAPSGMRWHPARLKGLS